jgi:16S rRNA (cytidine1402-2'-O)-methyltransferase
MTDSTLYIVATPIGNLSEMSLRGMETLIGCEMVLCEDTRVTNKLLNWIDGQPGYEGKRGHQSLFRLDEAVQLKMIPQVLRWLSEGKRVALVTDAGMPCVSDPGWRVVAAVREAGYEVGVISGPSALTTAIAASGIEGSRVWFGGFLPKKAGHRQEVLEAVREQFGSGMITMAVVYESPQRVLETLEEIRMVLGKNILVAACGELTKVYEKVIRGTVDEVMGQLPRAVKGEWVLVLGKG